MDIRRSEALPRTEVEEIPGSGTYVWEIPENRIIWSKGLLELYGVSEPPSGDTGFAALVHPEDRVRVEAETSWFLESGDSYEHEFRIVRPDGTVRKVHDRGAIDRDAQGVAIRIRGLNVDVTTFRDDTGELAAARRTIVDLVERSPFGICTIDADLTLVQVSQGARDMFSGVRPLLGAHLSDVLAALFGDRFAATAIEHFTRTLETGEPFHSVASVEPGDAGSANTIDWRIERVVLADGRFGVVCHFVDLSRQFEQEKALWESEARLRLAHRAAGMGAWDLDLTTNTSTWSHELYDLLGLPPGIPATPDLLLDLVLPEDLPALMRKFLKAIASGTYFENVFRIRRPDGEIRFIAGRGQVVESDAAGPTRMIGVNFDVTEQARAEQKVRESEARLRTLIDSSIAFIAVLDDEGRIIDANAPLLEAGGLQRADVVGVPLWRSAWWPASSDAERQLRSVFRRLRLQARTLVGRGESITLEAELNFGRLGPRTLFLGFFPSVDAEGNLRQIIMSGLDITDRKLAEERLRASEETFRTLVERSPFGIFVVDADFRLRLASKGGRNVFGGDVPPVGRDFAEIQRELWPEPHASEIVERFRHTLATGEPYHAPGFTLQRTDSNTLESYDWMIARISMPDGRPGVVCHFYDLSERQRHEEHVKLLMQELNHRAKNMLSLIQAIARQTAAGGTESFLPDFEMRLRALAASQDLMVEHAWTSVPLDELVQTQLAHLAEASDGRISLDGAPLSVTPTAAQALGLALNELATNATKHGSLSQGSGQVRIGWEIEMKGPEAPRFSMSWEECNGPPVTVPDRCGFGTNVMTRMVEMNLGGRVSLDYPRSGLVWRVNCPADSVIEGDLSG